MRVVVSRGGASMKNPIDLHIGQRLRHRRWLRGMTQQDLAQAIGVRFQQIQKYESGANRISASRLWDLACALTVPVSFFYVGLGEANQSTENQSVEDGAFQQKETTDLVRAYYAMPEGPRRRLFELAQAVSKAEALSEVVPFPPSQSAA
jgi:transcriptional regulator with XRE-family HTH domain